MLATAVVLAILNQLVTNCSTWNIIKGVRKCIVQQEILC